MEKRAFVTSKEEFLDLSDEDARQLLLNYMKQWPGPLHILLEEHLLCGCIQMGAPRVLLYALRARPGIYEGPEVNFCPTCLKESISVQVSGKVQS